VYKIHTDVPDLIARVGLTMKAFAERAGIAESTLYALLNPEDHENHTCGYLYGSQLGRSPRLTLSPLLDAMKTKPTASHCRSNIRTTLLCPTPR
jgi:hypothetical protein